MSAVSAEDLAPRSLAASRLARLPKVCLHDHLDGALRPRTVVELAAECGHELPEREAGPLRRWFAEAADSGSLERYLETFEHTVAVLQSAAALERAAEEYVLDAAEDGIVYAEVRWAPEQHQRGGLSLEDAVAAVGRGLAEGERAAARRGYDLTVRQILCAMRHADRSLEVARLATGSRALGVVGFDLAGPEDGHGPSVHREALLHCAEHFLPVTLHAGEAAGTASIREALLDGRSLRLGHGVRILRDVSGAVQGAALGENVARFPGNGRSRFDAEAFELGELASWVRDRGIPLEVCPSSNLQTGAAPRLADIVAGEAPARPAAAYAEHPVELLRTLGFTITINPDNRLMSGTSMTHEFARLKETFGYEAEDFLEVTMNAALAAFLPVDQKNELVEQLLAGYAEARA
ncbi:adenosine deaminase [Rothia santali]|uniref:adenosine deaminase n=1 Tax=Rothia santali TaxID=2949643 RepID=UPI0035A13A43